MHSPSSVRFDPDVLRRLRDYVASHPGLSASGAANQLVDEALRMREHPLVVFRDGPMGRRARLVMGPDIWEIVRAVRSASASEPQLAAEEVVTLVAETTGLTSELVRAAVAYWSDFADEVDALIELADAAEVRAQERWARERDLLG